MNDDWSTWKTFWVYFFCFLAFAGFLSAIVTAVVTDPNRKHGPRITQVKQYGQDCIAVPKDDPYFKDGMYCKDWPN